MRKCPVCNNVILTQVEYEGFRILQCKDCYGYLVPKRRMEFIKRTVDKSQEDLMEDVSAEFKGSSSERLRCPKCFQKMTKHRIKMRLLDIQADVCESCDLIWFEGGKLALLKLAYMGTEKFSNAQDIKQRLEGVDASPERKAMYKANLSQLPREKSMFEQVMSDMWHKGMFE